PGRRLRQRVDRAGRERAAGLAGDRGRRARVARGVRQYPRLGRGRRRSRRGSGARSRARRIHGGRGTDDRTVMRSPFVLFVLSTLLCGSSRAEEPATVEEALREGERRTAELDYRGAAEVCTQASHDPRATTENQAKALECVGLS